jgi:DNA-binding response OmpR family regulator
VSGQRHIVVVDDEEVIRSVVARYLIKHGYDVSQADGGAALRAILAERPVDLVILDITTPIEDGLSVARYLRGLGPIGIIMLTGAGDPVDRVIGLEIGADDYMAKPFDMRELLARVRAVLRRAEHTETGRPSWARRCGSAPAPTIWRRGASIPRAAHPCRSPR